MAEEKKEKTFTEKEVIEMIQRALKKHDDAQAMQRKNDAPTTVVQVSEDKYVTLMFIGCIASGTSVALNDLGKITRPATAIDVSKKDFVKSLGVPVVENLLRDRQLLVLDGLTDDERTRFGLMYKPGEVLTADQFYSVVKMSADEICGLFPKLCKTHRQVIIDLLLTAYFEQKDTTDITLAKVKKINKISKSCGYPNGALAPILKEMANDMIADED